MSRDTDHPHGDELGTRKLVGLILTGSGVVLLLLHLVGVL